MRSLGTKKTKNDILDDVMYIVCVMILTIMNRFKDRSTIFSIKLQSGTKRRLLSMTRVKDEKISGEYSNVVGVKLAAFIFIFSNI